MASSVLNENVQKRKSCFIVTVRIYVAYILLYIHSIELNFSSSSTCFSSTMGSTTSGSNRNALLLFFA